MGLHQSLPWSKMSRLALRVANLALAVVLLLGGSLAGGQVPGGSASVASQQDPRWPASGSPGVYRLDAATATPTVDPRLPVLYLQMEAAWTAQNWPLVLSLVDQMIAIDPHYDSIADRHYYAHVGYGLQLTSASQCSQALDQFNQALQLRPGGTEALDGLALLLSYCPTPTPPPVTATPLATTTVWPTTTLAVTPTPSAVAPGLPVTYVVQPGDTLYSLARRFGTTVQAIMQANGMMTYYLRAGSTITIPAADTSLPGPLVHIVQPGETLTSLARAYHTTVWAIMAANGLTNYSIWAYQALFVPAPLGVPLIAHVVMPGETIYTIAAMHGTTVSLIMLANGLKTYSLTVYQHLIVPPPGWTGYPPLAPVATPAPPLPASRIYLVRAGDTLYSIARRYGTTPTAIVAANGLTSTNLSVGMRLRIP